MKNETKKKIAAISLTAIIAGSLTSSVNHNHELRSNWDPSFDKDLFSYEQLTDNYENRFSYDYENSYYVPQGVCLDDEHIYVSLYDYKHQNQSKLNVFDMNGHFIHSFNLDNRSHVGGIAYDKNNNLIWVSSSYGNIEAYRVSDVLNKNNEIAYYKDLYVGDGLPNYINPFSNSVSFLTIDGNDLYVGNFSILTTGNVKRYTMKMDEDQTIHLLYQNQFKIPGKVQGMTFYEKNDSKYLLLSESFGEENASRLQIFKYDHTINDYSNRKSTSVDFPPMMEQIIINGNLLYSVFESGSKPYQNRYNGKTLRITKMDDLSLF